MQKNTQRLFQHLLYPVIALACTCLSLSAAEKQPNILLFLTDDDSALDRSAYGWTNIPTPGFDRVAEQGVLFKNAYSSVSSCAPARATILTGRHFWQNEEMAFIQGFLRSEIPTLTNILAESGYFVGMTVKDNGPVSSPPNSQDNVLGPRYQSEMMESVPPEIRPYDYAANFMKFLEDREARQPFFFWAGVIEPHWPWGDENYKLLEEEFGISVDEIKLPPALEDTRAMREWWGGYLYAICYADTHLQRMLDHLEAIGELDNTIIIAAGDNGAYLPVDASRFRPHVPPDEGPLRSRGKSSPYDYGVHVPLAIMWPEGIPANRVVEDFVSFADFAPTLLEIIGIEAPEGMTGKSLTSILKSDQSGMIEQRDLMRTGLEWHGELDPISRSSRALRKGDFTYIVFYDNVDEAGNPLSNEELSTPVEEALYDLSNDRWQLNDLIDDPDYADILSLMRELYIQNGLAMDDPRVTGEMDLFRTMRQYVQQRKKIGYKKTVPMSVEEVLNH